MYGLDLTKKCNTTGLVYGVQTEATIKEIVAYLEKTFCGTMALEVAHLQVSVMYDVIVMSLIM